MLGWLSQSSVPQRVTLAISLPNSEAWQSQFLGALYLLTEERNWEEHGTLSSEEMADEWRAVFFDFVNGVASMIPAGIITGYGGSSIPDGWLLCNGDSISRTTYASLFAAIGTSYGFGDGSTTFGIPDLQAKIPVGRLSVIPSVDTLGETGGAMSHTLTIGEMPSHTHIQNSHNHGIDSGTSTGGVTSKIIRDALQNFLTGNPLTNSTTAVNQNSGGGASHNNMQPYQVVNYIIKF